MCDHRRRQLRSVGFAFTALTCCQMTLSGVDPARVVVGNVVCKAGGVLQAVRRFNAQIVALPALEVSRDGWRGMWALRQSCGPGKYFAGSDGWCTQVTDLLCLICLLWVSTDACRGMSGCYVRGWIGSDRIGSVGQVGAHEDVTGCLGSSLGSAVAKGGGKALFGKAQLVVAIGVVQFESRLREGCLEPTK